MFVPIWSDACVSCASHNIPSSSAGVNVHATPLPECEQLIFFGKILWCTHERIFVPMESLQSKYKKNTKKQPRELMFNTWSNPYPYCYKPISRDSAAPARPPEASSTQLPPLGRAPGGNTWHHFVRASFFSFFVFWVVGVRWVQIYSRGYTIDFCHFFSL